MGLRVGTWEDIGVGGVEYTKGYTKFKISDSVIM
jgi:hypothetical protein